MKSKKVMMPSLFGPPGQETETPSDVPGAPIPPDEAPVAGEFQTGNTLFTLVSNLNLFPGGVYLEKAPRGMREPYAVVWSFDNLTDTDPHRETNKAYYTLDSFTVYVRVDKSRNENEAKEICREMTSIITEAALLGVDTSLYGVPYIPGTFELRNSYEPRLPSGRREMYQTSDFTGKIRGRDFPEGFDPIGSRLGQRKRT